jgi:hypothetical protein
MKFPDFLPATSGDKKTLINRVGSNRSLVFWVSGISRKRGSHPHPAGRGSDPSGIEFRKRKFKNRLS